MKDLLDLILKHITTSPDDVVINESEDKGTIVYQIQVNPEDMGRVIGKDGKVIRAIRSLAHVIAVRQGKRFRIKLGDEDTQTQAETNTEEASDLVASAIEA